MAKRRGQGNTARQARASTDGGAQDGATRIALRPAKANGGRAVPGKVPRGSVPWRRNGGIFSPLGKLILDKLDRGVLLLDVEGAVLDANSLAEKVLLREHGLRVKGGRLAFPDAQLDARFARLLAQPARSPRSLAARVRPGGSGSYRVRISSLQPAAAAREAAFLVVLYAPGEKREISREVLLELYGLTRAQADVARMLYAGNSVEETAAELDLSLNTVRTHLKHIFSKCEVQSQGELLHTFALGPLSL
jgi:DNA-binding CsgD family transcriptional regulator